MQRMKKYASVVPGLLIAVAVAAAARFLEGLLPIHLIGASVIALFIGMGINALRKPSALVAGGLKFTSKRVLKLAIILLGASLSMRDILTVGRLSLMVMCFTLLTCFGGGYLVGRSLGLKLEAEQPDLCGHRHLRRIGHCGHRARDRRAGPRYRLRHVRHLPV